MKALVATWVTPILAVTLPPIVYPHLLFSFILPLPCWVVGCFAFLCTSAVLMHVSQARRSSGASAAPSLALEQPATAEASLGRSVKYSDISNINVVDLEVLQTALNSQTAEEVLRRLYDTSELLRPVRIDGALTGCSLAIISYRQVRSKHDPFTLDIDAFRAAVKRAREAKIDALWLDCWCYRREGEYDHAAFCAELGAVMGHIAAVIWLPRSRTGAPPSYQFRLWCSFEASVVAKRLLPVYIAGQGLAPSQVALRRFGIFLPALIGMPPPVEVRAMAYVNALLALVALLFPPVAPTLFFQTKKGWHGRILPKYDLEAALARNGQLVLRAMQEGVQRAKAGTPPSPTSADQREDVLDSLGKMMPWLPAYDRRDALVVWTLLRKLSNERRRRRSSVFELPTSTVSKLKLALAASCFTAARMEPSEGDPVGSLDIQAWLQQKDIGMPMERGIHLSALKHFGWSLLRGCPDMLKCPTGMLRMPMPPTVAASGDCRWDASATQPMAEVPVVVQMGAYIFFWVASCFFMLVLAVTLAIDLQCTPEDDERCEMKHMLWGMSVVSSLWTFALLTELFVLGLLPSLYNYPHLWHLGSFTGSTVGPNAFKDLVIVLLIGIQMMGVSAFVLLLIDTSAFSQPTRLFSTVYTAELAHAAHPGVAIAPLCYGAVLATAHVGAMLWLIVAAHVTWHMWHCGLRSGVRYMLASPDSESASVVCFARPAHHVHF